MMAAPWVNRIRNKVRNTLRVFEPALFGCYRPPPINELGRPVDLTFQVSFKRSGERLGKPRVVNLAPFRPTSGNLAVTEAVDLFSPMPFNFSMVEGRTVPITIIDSRNQRQAMNHE